MHDGIFKGAGNGLNIIHATQPIKTVFDDHGPVPDNIPNVAIQNLRYRVSADYSPIVGDLRGFAGPFTVEPFPKTKPGDDLFTVSNNVDPEAVVTLKAPVSGSGQIILMAGTKEIPIDAFSARAIAAVLLTACDVAEGKVTYA